MIYKVPIEPLAIGEKGIEISWHGKVKIPYAVEGFANDDRSKPEDKIPGGGGLFRPRG